MAEVSGQPGMTLWGGGGCGGLEFPYAQVLFVSTVCFSLCASSPLSGSVSHGDTVPGPVSVLSSPPSPVSPTSLCESASLFSSAPLFPGSFSGKLLHYLLEP